MKNGMYQEKSGSIRWYKNDDLHREDGPASEWASGTKCWYINGKRHRENGPAIEYPEGAKAWYLNDKELSEKEFNQWLDKKNLNEKLESMLPIKVIQKRKKL